MSENTPDREAPAFAMTDEEILRLVQEDSSSDYNEGVGEYGGYVDWNVRDGVLTVTVRPYTAEADDDPAGPLVRQWRLVPADARAMTVPGVPAAWKNGQPVTDEERARIALLRLAGCTDELPLLGWRAAVGIAMTAVRCRLCNAEVAFGEPVR
jgi:hypothetical protein